MCRKKVFKFIFVLYCNAHEKPSKNRKHGNVYTKKNKHSSYIVTRSTYIDVFLLVDKNRQTVNMRIFFFCK